MIFNTPVFFLFFVAFLLLYGLVFLQRRPRIWLIVVASLVFYGAWNYKFIPLLLFSGLADYYIAQAIGRATAQRTKRQLVSLSIVINLGVLGLFKYADFVLYSVADLLGLFGVTADMPTLALVLPVGISFYTFQSLSYTIDVYRGDMEPRRGLPEFIAALSFFPQLVAGPILRAKQILPQMHVIPHPTWDEVKHAFVLITAGVLKKTVADLLAGPAGRAFDADASVSVLETWTGVLAFAGQIYGDFAGYTDMAIGLALLLGFKIPLNFRVPYFAASPVDFWRRWHISLSTWLRDYLYIPLGGNRNNHRVRNVMLTMLLGGLWHGAAWTFVAWGAFHGILITVSHALGKVPGLASFHSARAVPVRIVKWLLTFYLVTLAWVFFRATSLGSALDILGIMHGFGGELPATLSVAPTLFGLALLALATMHLMDYFVLYHSDKLERRWWLLWPVLILIHAVCLAIGEPSNEFIYFQF